MHTYKKITLFLLYLLTVSYAQGASTQDVSTRLQKSTSLRTFLASNDNTKKQKIDPLLSDPRKKNKMHYENPNASSGTEALENTSVSEMEEKLNLSNLLEEIQELKTSIEKIDKQKNLILAEVQKSKDSFKKIEEYLTNQPNSEKNQEDGPINFKKVQLKLQECKRDTLTLAKHSTEAITLIGLFVFKTLKQAVPCFRR